jgi:predicted MFS family arabinose efflux permease
MALLIATLAPSAGAFLAASLLIGIGSVAVQMLVPMAAHMTPDAIRGRVVGNVMSGLLMGIMLARPVSSLIANSFGWRAVFGASTVMMMLLALVLWRLLPQRQPKADHTYASLIRSLWTLLRTMPVLRRRAAYHAALFAAFSLYWTTVPLVLTSALYGFSQGGVALFALAGALGVLSAPVAGRMADRGWTRIATGVSLGIVALAFLLARVGGTGSLIALLAAGILLDLGVQSNLVLGQRAIYALGPHIRSRLTRIIHRC